MRSRVLVRTFVHDRPLGLREYIAAMVLTLAALVVPTAWATCIDYSEYLHVAGAAQTSGRATGIAIRDDLAYVADGEAGLRIFDVSDPTRPRPLGVADTDGTAQRVAVSDDYAYIADFTSGLVVFDVSDATAPMRVGGVDTDGRAEDVVVLGPLAYIADAWNGLVVVDVSEPALPIEIGQVDTPGAAKQLVVFASHAYVAAGTGLQIIDVSNPAVPVIVASLVEPGGSWRGVVRHGNRICASIAYSSYHDFYGALRIVDVSNPAAPFDIEPFYRLTNSPTSIDVIGDYAFVGSGLGVLVVDLTDPAEPRFVSDIRTGGSVTQIEAREQHVFVSLFSEGMVTLDRSSFRVPPLLGRMNASTPRAMAVSGSMAYVLNTEHPVQCVDISDPAHPVLLGSTFEVEGNAIAVSGNLILTSGPIGLQISDVSDPANPRWIVERAPDRCGLAAARCPRTRSVSTTV
jgi:hypothetical protein